MRYGIENTSKGYVVYAYGSGIGSLPLRNFGDNQSAAFEFRDFCKKNVDERKAVRYAKTYEPDKLYTYPEIRNGKATLRRQRRHEE